MFETTEPAPRNRSLVGLIIASILLPPLGILLLWLRRGTATATKIGATSLMVALTAGYVFVFLQLWRGSNESHYTELEKHRAQQQQGTTQSAATASQPNAPTTSASPTGTSNEVASAHATRNYWTNFRGPNRDGVYEEMEVSTAARRDLLSSGSNQSGWASPPSWSPISALATIEQRRGKKPLRLTMSTADASFGHKAGVLNTTTRPETARATPTGTRGGLCAGRDWRASLSRCKDWRGYLGQNIHLSDNQAADLQWAMAASPLVVDDKVIVLPGGSANKSVVAYNKMTGAPVWKSQSDRQTYVSPMLVTLAGRRQVVVVSSSRAFGLEPGNGSLLWSYDWRHGHGDQCLAADHGRCQSLLHLVWLRQRRGAGRSHGQR